MRVEGKALDSNSVILAMIPNPQPSTLNPQPNMAIEFKLPEVSDGVKTVDIAEIKVKAGDVITAGQAVMDLETEKAVVELECPHAGTVAKVYVTAGQTVAIGTPLLSIEAGATSAAPTAAPPSTAPGGSPPQPTAPIERPRKRKRNAKVFVIGFALALDVRLRLPADGWRGVRSRNGSRQDARETLVRKPRKARVFVEEQVNAPASPG